MSLYEEYKARLKADQELLNKKDEPGCTTCRKKIAQETFNMVTNASHYLPKNEPLQGNFKTVEELCYPNHNNTDNRHLENAIDRLYGRKMPDYTPENVIDMMYGRKLPEYKPVNAIDELYGISHKNTISGKLQTEPCGISEDKFLFDNTVIKELFFGTELSNNCKLNLMYMPYIKKETFEHFLKIDLSVCCEKFIKTIFCENVIQKYNLLEVWKGILETQYSNFSKCAEKIIDDAIDSIDLSREIDGGIRNKELLRFKKKQFLYGIDLAKERFLRNDELIKKYTNFNGENSQSCLCGGSFATYCCYPDENPEKCWCPDGNLKNLCKDCEENVPVELPLPFEIEIKSKSGRRCWAQLTESGNTFKIYYWVYSTSGDLINSGDDFILKLPPIEPFNYERRLLAILIPKNENCNIKIQIEFDCGWCCDVKNNGNEVHTNRKRVVTKYFDNFNLQDWESKPDDEKKAFLNFNFQLNYDFGTEDFNTKNINCFCQDC